jgi:hypothetical protein
MLFSALIISSIDPELLSCECKKTALEFVKIGKRWNMNCFNARRSFKDRQDKRTLAHGPFIALKRLQNGVVQPIGNKLETKKRHHPHQTNQFKAGDRRPNARIIRKLASSVSASEEAQAVRL